MKRKLFNSVFAAITALSVILPSVVLAEEERVTYIDGKGAVQPLTEDYTELGEFLSASTADSPTLTTGWYVARGEISTEKIIKISGRVNLILADKASVSAADQILVTEGNSFTVYAQSQPSLTAEGKVDETLNTAGSLTVTASADKAGIGSSFSASKDPGEITITGGIVTATGGNSGAGIGGGNFDDGGTITINGGFVTATGGKFSAGIGGGYSGAAGNITIDDGNITAAGGGGGAGIGRGSGCNTTGDKITINNGTVNATGGDTGAGIGGGFAPVGYSSVAGCEITINGGTITAKCGKEYGAGIGGGEYGAAGTITIKGGTVTATGGESGAGIGSGYKLKSKAPGSITISGGDITAAGGDGGAGIGGGYGAEEDSSFGDILITAGTVKATGGNNSAGIGQGKDSYGAFGNITISGGKVTALGGSNYGNGIGANGRKTASFGKITISGGKVTATAGSTGWGIGNQVTVNNEEMYGTTEIDGGTVLTEGYFGAFNCEPALNADVDWKISAASDLEGTLTPVASP